MPQNLTLEQYLRLPNPTITNHDGRKNNGDPSSGTTKNPRWKTPRRVNRWKKFDSDLADAIFREYKKDLREILKIESDFNNFTDLKFPFCDIRNEDSLDTLLIKSIQSTVCEALTVAQSDLLEPEHQEIGLSEVQTQIIYGNMYMARGGQAAFKDLELEVVTPSTESEQQVPSSNGARRSERIALSKESKPKDIPLDEASNDVESPPSEKSNYNGTLSKTGRELKRGKTSSGDTEKENTPPKKKSKRKPWLPDWAGIIPSRSEQKPDNLLPGDTKLSTAFASKDIDTGYIGNTSSKEGRSKESQWKWPLAQIHTYCLNANARYGYLITDQELVVLQVRPVCPHALTSADEPRGCSECGNSQSSVFEGDMVFKSIPWTHTVSDELTINLALWGLHLMAARDGGLTKNSHAQKGQSTNNDTQENDVVQESQPSKGQDAPDTQNTQDSFTNFDSLDSQDNPRTPGSDLQGAESQDLNASFMSETSGVRRQFSATELHDSSPTAGKGGRKRQRAPPPNAPRGKKPRRARGGDK